MAKKSAIENNKKKAKLAVKATPEAQALEAAR